MATRTTGTVNTTAFVDEDGLAKGNPGGVNDLPGEEATSSALISLSYANGKPATANPFTWKTDDLSGITSQGKAVSFSVSNDGLTLTATDTSGAVVFDIVLEDTDSGLFKASLYQPLDHTVAKVEDDIIMSIGFDLTDSSGTVSSDSIAFFVDDDSPVVSLSGQDEVVVSNNTYTGDWSVDAGADGLSSVTVKVPGDSTAYSLDTPIQLDIGELTLNSDGTWTFIADSGATGAGSQLTFTVSAADGDGDTTSKTFTTEITAASPPTTTETDGDPSTKTPTAVVDEDGLPGGAEGGVGDVPGQSVVSTGRLGYSFGANGPASSGEFSWHLSDMPSLTSGGDPISYRLSGNGRSLVGTTPDGQRALSIQLSDVATGKYIVAIAQPLDHSSAGIEDNIAFSLGYTITDSQGLSADGKIDITINDDSPVANQDVATTDSATPVTVNILDNDRPGGDGTKISGLTVAGGAATGTVSANADGTVTFTPNASFSGSANITYTVTDGDGDKASGKLVVSVDSASGSGPVTPITDDDPSTLKPIAVVDEDGLPGGLSGGFNDVPTNTTVRTGSLGYDFGSNGAASSGAFTWHLDGLPQLTSRGEDVTYVLTNNGRSILGKDPSGKQIFSIQLIDLARGTYEVTLDQNLDHRQSGIEDDFNLKVNYTITDSKGLSAPGKLVVIFDDDSPVTEKFQAATDNETPITIDLMAEDRAGADGFKDVSAVVLDGASVGVVTVNDDNTITFTPNSEFTGSAIVKYTITDGDGDTATDKVVIAVGDAATTGPTTPETDGDPATVPPFAKLDEDGLPGGKEGGINDIVGTATAVTGKLGYDFGEKGPLSAQGAFAWDVSTIPDLTSNGLDVNFFLNGNGRSLIGYDENGARVLTIQLFNLNSGSYRVVLHKPLDHRNPVAEDDISFNLGYKITDAAGESASGTLRVLIDDDSPTLNNDTIASDDNSAIVVDVTGNDSFGGDGGFISSANVVGGADVGVVTINNDGTLTFTPADGFEGSAVIDYKVTDNDGDVSTARLTVNVLDDGINPVTPETDGDPSTKSPVVTLDEDGLENGIPGGSGDVSGEAVSATGTLGYSFGEDGAASSGAFSWKTTGLPSLTASGSPITYNVSANGLFLTGVLDDASIVMQVAITNLAKGEFKVELFEALDHPEVDVEDNIQLEIGYTIKDSDGDVADGKLGVVFNDDSPSAFEADSSFLEDGASGDINFSANAGADGVGGVAFDSDLDGSAAIGSSGNALVFDGDELTYSLDDDGKTLSAVTEDGDVAFSVTLSDDDLSYTVEVDKAFSSGETNTAVISTGTEAENRKFIAYNVADGVADNDVLISSDGSIIGRDKNSLGVNDSTISKNETIRVDFLNNAIISDSSARWSSHQSISRYEQVIFVDGKDSATASLKLSAYEFDADSGADSGVPDLGSGSLMNLSVSDITVFDVVGINVTSEVSVTDSGKSILINGMKDGWRVELATETPFQSVEITGGSGSNFSLGGLEYRSGGEGGDLEVSYGLVGTDGDGDTALGSLSLETEAEDRVISGGDGDDHLKGGRGDDVIIGDDGGAHSIIENGKDYNLSLILDLSHSMYSKTQVPADSKYKTSSQYKTRLELLREAVEKFIDGLKDHAGTININVVIFNDHAWTREYKDISGNNSYEDIIRHVNGWKPGGNTNTEDAFRKAEGWFKGISGNNYENQTIFFTDGTPDHYMKGDDNRHKVWTVENKQITMQETVEAFNDLTRYSDVHAIGWDETPKTRTSRPDDKDVANITPYFDNTDVIGEKTVILDDGTSFTGTVGEAEIVDTEFELHLAFKTGSSQTGYKGLGDDVIHGGDGDDIIFGDTTNSDALSWVNGDTGAKFDAGTHDGMGLRGVFEFLKWSEFHNNGKAAPTNEQVADYIRGNYESLLETTRTQGGDDQLSGGAGDDILIGGGGADTFVFKLADLEDADTAPTDTVVDFHLGKYGVDGGADRLDLSDLLDDASERYVDDYIHAEQSGSDAVLSIKSDGGINSDGSNADQVIILSNVSVGGSGDNFISNLISNNQLDVD